MRLTTCAALLLTLAAFPRPALADSDCSSWYVDRVQPADGQSDVPLNVRVRALLRRDPNQCQTDYFDAKLTLSAGGAPVSATFLSTSTGLPYKELIPDAPLEPSTTYTVLIEGWDLQADAGVTTTTTFTTGTQTLPPLMGSPDFEILDQTYNADAEPSSQGNVIHYAFFQMTPSAADPAELSLLHLVHEGHRIGTFAFGSDATISSIQTVPAAPDAELCFGAEEEDGAGHTASSDMVCQQSEPEGGGCRVAPGSGRPSALGWMAVAVACLMLRVRRRRPRAV